jgi:hypothetical protein
MDLPPASPNYDDPLKLLEMRITAGPQLDAAPFCGFPLGRIGLSAVGILRSGE